MIKIEKSSAPRVVIGKHLTNLIEKNNKIIVIDNDSKKPILKIFGNWESASKVL